MNGSRMYYNRAIKQLRDRLHDTPMAQSEATLAAMMFLISYEVSVVDVVIKDVS